MGSTSFYAGEGNALAHPQTPKADLRAVPKLSSLTLAVHDITHAEMKFVSTINSIRSLTLGEAPDSIIIERAAYREFFGMEFLECLEICSSRISGDDFQGISKMIRLKELTIHQDIDCRAIKKISLLRSLVRLRIEATHFSNESVKLIMSMPKLESIAFSGANLSRNAIDTLVQNRTLTTVSFGVDSEEFKRNSTMGLGGMQQLKNLSYGNAKMGLDEFALREVATLVNLECLNCYINETSWEHLTHLQRLKKLHSIELRANMYISGENLKALSYHPSLEKVYLTYMKDTEVVDVLITMPNLKMLMTADKADSEVVKYAKSRLNGVEIITH